MREGLEQHGYGAEGYWFKAQLVYQAPGKFSRSTKQQMGTVLNQGRTRQQKERRLMTSLKNFDDIKLLFWLLSVTCHVHLHCAFHSILV